MEIPFEPAPMGISPIRQETEVSVVRVLRGLPALAQLVREFAARVRSHGGDIRGLATYVPNEVHLQRYRPGSFGITPYWPSDEPWRAPPHPWYELSFGQRVGNGQVAGSRKSPE